MDFDPKTLPGDSPMFHGQFTVPVGATFTLPATSLAVMDKNGRQVMHVTRDGDVVVEDDAEAALAELLADTSYGVAPIARLALEILKLRQQQDAIARVALKWAATYLDEQWNSNGAASLMDSGSNLRAIAADPQAIDAIKQAAKTE